MTTTITLESIKAEHSKLAGMIAAFEKQQEPSALFFPEVTIKLAPGEHYAGLVIGKDGEPSYHLVLCQVRPTTSPGKKPWNGPANEAAIPSPACPLAASRRCSTPTSRRNSMGGPTGPAKPMSPSPAGLGIRASTSATRATTPAATSSALVPSADCQFDHSVISRTL